MNPIKLRSLSILKGIGIIMVIIVHNRHFIMNDMSGLRQIINYGQMGCQLFLVVSGISLCYSWFGQCKASTGSSLSHYTKFIKKRYLRLAPGYLIILAVNLLLNFIFIDILNYSPGYVMNRTPEAVLTNILFLHGFSPKYINSVFPGGWYIGTTFILYLIFPIVAGIFKKLHAIHRHLVVLPPFVFWIANLLLSYIVSELTGGSYYPHNNSFMYFLFTNQLPCFSLGIMLYYLEKDNFSHNCPLSVSIPSCIVLTALSILLFTQSFRVYIYTLVPFTAGIAFFWLVCAMLHVEQTLTQLGRTEKKRSILLSGIVTILERIGNHSYGMYLTHSFVSWYGIKLLTDSLKYHGFAYNDLLLYFVLLIPSIFLVYKSGLLMDKLLNYCSSPIQKGN